MCLHLPISPSPQICEVQPIFIPNGQRGFGSSESSNGLAYDRTVRTGLDSTQAASSVTTVTHGQGLPGAIISLGLSHCMRSEQLTVIYKATLQLCPVSRGPSLPTSRKNEISEFSGTMENQGFAQFQVPILLQPNQRKGLLYGGNTSPGCPTQDTFTSTDSEGRGRIKQPCSAHALPLSTGRS